MDIILNFLADNYIYFMIGAAVLLVALIGFIVDGKKKKNKGDEVPDNTATLNQVNAMAQDETSIPSQDSIPVEPSLVFEQPSLNDNETMKELSSTSNEPSLTFENPMVESQPVDTVSNQSENFEIGNNESNSNIGDSIGTGIGEPIEMNQPSNISTLVEPSTNSQYNLSESSGEVIGQPISTESSIGDPIAIPTIENVPLSSEIQPSQSIEVLTPTSDINVSPSQVESMVIPSIESESNSEVIVEPSVIDSSTAIEAPQPISTIEPSVTTAPVIPNQMVDLSETNNTNIIQ